MGSNRGIAQPSRRPTMNYVDLEWQQSGACRGIADADKFFPMKGALAASRAAKQVCRECPVVRVCLEYALDMKERHGVWGGLSSAERDALKRRRNRRATR